MFCILIYEVYVHVPAQGTFFTWVRTLKVPFKRLERRLDRVL